MNQWKKAFWLSRCELKRSMSTYVLLFICLVFLLMFIVPTIGDYLEVSTFGIDVFFILIFTAIVQWCRPKTFRSQVNESGLSVSQQLVMLNQLPIQKEIIIKHRLLSYLMFSLPFHIAFLTLLYALTPVLREAMPMSSYLVFSIFWICLSIYTGFAEPASEAGYYRFPVIVRNLAISFVIVIVVLIVFHKILPFGLVHWIMLISTKYPLIVTILSLVFARLGLIYWQQNMRQKMDSFDYY